MEDWRWNRLLFKIPQTIRIETMKYLIIIFFLFSLDSHACSKRVSVLELSKIQAGQSAVAGCREGSKCFCYEGLDLREVSVGMKSVDDKTKPIYQDIIETEQVLKGYEQKEVDDESKPITDVDGNVTGYEKKLVDDETKPIFEEVSTVVGQEIVGYEQKQVEGLIVDEAKRAAKIAKKEHRELEQQKNRERKERHDEAMAELLDSLTLADDDTPLSKDEIKANVKALKDAVKDKKSKI